MELVGKVVTKEFKGFGVFEGVVESYDSTTAFYRILYEDGDSEEVDFSEVSRLLTSPSSNSVGPVPDKVAGKKVGRKPKRRRRNPPVDPGKFDGNPTVVNGELNENLVIEPHLGQNLENNVDVNDCVVDGGVGGGLDLNREFESNEGVKNGGIRGCIDLNLSFESTEFDGNEVRAGKVGSLGAVSGEEEKKERGFDLNLGFNDEDANGVNGNMEVEACVGLDEELRNGGGVGVDGNHVNRWASDGELRGRGSDGVALVQSEDGNSGRRKKMKVLRSPSETVLRRSARRAKAAVFSESVTPSAMVDDGANEVCVSGVTEELEEKHVARDLERVVETEVPASKIGLPPSSANLNLEGIPVADLFSVYSCLRSFSTLLYLSPFELDDLIAALKSRVSNLLIDLIHVSILQTLRKHLEFLAKEGCESASTCLRNLNWDLLDVITWPVFMVEYLLIHGSGLKPGFSLSQMKLFDGNYYKQSADVKIELLRCLCDDVIEVETIRSELSRRKTMAEANVEDVRTMNSDLYRKRKFSSDTLGDSCLSENVEEVADGNSDECCLCKMDGNLICCDGCPAAYHSKCVGIVSSLLPEGDWYCPECVISRRKVGNKHQKLTQGAELLGIDPYGRLFFSCFDYLLVSNSYDADSSFSYYHKDNRNTIIEFMRSYGILYASILSAISRHWAMPTDLTERISDFESENCMLKFGDSVGRNTKNSTNPGHSGHLGTETENLLTSSEGLPELVQPNGVIQNSDRPLSNVTARGTSAKRISAAKKRKKSYVAGQSKSPCLKVKEEDLLHVQPGDGYMNSYSFAQTAASIVEELLRKPSDKVSIDIPKTEEEIISIQLKFILKKSTKFCWTSIQDLNGERRKEKCGWCYCCRFPVEDRDCLFNVKNSSFTPVALKSEIDAILSKRNKKGHLVDVICYILCMEERLRGLLLGPWLSPHYSELWRKRVLKASDVSSLRYPLVMLESNLHPLALSADWSKHVDSVTTMGSASYFVASSRVTSKNGISRKKGRCADSETKRSTAGSGLNLLWWRGGKTSRSLFNWKVIPRSLALKAARKAGCMKIPDIQYSDSPENARRSKYVAWRAAVEASTSLEQLALQVKELDLFIRWDDIENAHPHFLLDKDSIKSIRLFKKVIIRRKCIEGTVVKYLLDFGKRRSIPEVVIKHGRKLEDSDGERKRYWLDEAFVPLYLLKSFEERRITRKAGKTNVSKVHKRLSVMRKPSREKGFAYLFSRAERADNYQCGHCNKNVPISEAVSCQRCNGFFHKRHVMRSSEGIAAGCTYTCHRCRAGKQVNNDSSRGGRKFGKLRHAKNLKVGRKCRSAILKAKPRKVGKAKPKYGRTPLRNDIKKQHREQPLALKNTNVSAGSTLRRSARKAKCLTLQSNVLVSGKKRKRKEFSSAELKKTSTSSTCKKERTQIFHSFWINGLWLSRKINDERVAKFKRKQLFAPSEFSPAINDQPRCSLCSEQKFTSALMYIACDICGDWFHGEAFGLNKLNIEVLMGFKCHVCREKSAPICPFVDISRDNDSPSMEAQSEARDAQVVSEVAVIQKETDVSQEFQSSEGPPGRLELTPQCFDGNSDQDTALNLDSELRVENGSPAGKEVISDVAECQNGELEPNLPTELDENSVLEANNIKLNESQLPALEET